MAGKETVFNQKQRKVLRKEIPFTEVAAGLVILVVLLLIVVWVLLQKNAYNPADRDVAAEALLQGSKEISLYKSPLKPWTENKTDSGSAAALALGIFPQSILTDNWVPSSRLKQFNRDNLFEIINGEAEKFLQQGFKALYYIVLENPTKTEQIDIELYDQGNQRGSRGVFSEYISKDTVIKQNGDAVYLMTTAGAIGRIGRFFFRIMGTAESASIRKKSTQLVDAFKSLPREKTKVATGYKVLNSGLGIDSSRIIFQGNNVFQFDFAKDFWFGNPEPSGTMRLFFHEEKSAEQSRALFDRLVSEQSFDFEIKEQGKDRAMLWHDYLKTWFGIRRSGKYIFGVENGADKKSVNMALNRLEKGVASEK